MLSCKWLFFFLRILLFIYRILLNRVNEQHGICSSSSRMNEEVDIGARSGGWSNNQSLANESIYDCANFSQDSPLSATWFQALIYILYTSVFFIALLGNVLVCYVVYKAPKTKPNNLTNYFIVNLAVGDILIDLFCVPTSFISTLILQYWPFKSQLCPVVNFSQVKYTLSGSSFHYYNVYKRLKLTGCIGAGQRLHSSGDQYRSVHSDNVPSEAEGWQKIRQILDPPRLAAGYHYILSHTPRFGRQTAPPNLRSLRPLHLPGGLVWSATEVANYEQCFIHIYT